MLELVPHQVLVCVHGRILLYDLGYITFLLWASFTLSVNWGCSPELSGESEKSQDASPTLRESYPVRPGIGPRYRVFLRCSTGDSKVYLSFENQ